MFLKYWLVVTGERRGSLLASENLSEDNKLWNILENLDSYIEDSIRIPYEWSCQLVWFTWCKVWSTVIESVGSYGIWTRWLIAAPGSCVQTCGRQMAPYIIMTGGGGRCVREWSDPLARAECSRRAPARLLVYLHVTEFTNNYSLQ